MDEDDLPQALEDTISDNSNPVSKPKHPERTVTTTATDVETQPILGSPVINDEVLGLSLFQNTEETTAKNRLIEEKLKMIKPGEKVRPEPARSTREETPIHLPVDRFSLCWRCGYPGHTRRNCVGIPHLFCSQCDRYGILT